MKDDSRNIKRVLYLVLTFAVLLSCSYPVTTIEDRELKFEFKRTSEGLPDYESMLKQVDGLIKTEYPNAFYSYSNSKITCRNLLAGDPTGEIAFKYYEVVKDAILHSRDTVHVITATIDWRVEKAHLLIDEPGYNPLRKDEDYNHPFPLDREYYKAFDLLKHGCKDLDEMAQIYIHQDGRIYESEILTIFETNWSAHFHSEKNEDFPDISLEVQITR